MKNWVLIHTRWQNHPTTGKIKEVRSVASENTKQSPGLDLEVELMEEKRTRQEIMNGN